jgi:hypothetical protein
MALDVHVGGFPTYLCREENMSKTAWPRVALILGSLVSGAACVVSEASPSGAEDPVAPPSSTSPGSESEGKAEGEGGSAARKTAAYGVDGSVTFKRMPHFPQVAFSRAGRVVLLHAAPPNVRMKVLLPDGRPDPAYGGEAGADVALPGASDQWTSLRVSPHIEDDGTVLLFGAVNGISPGHAFVGRVRDGKLDARFVSGGAYLLPSTKGAEARGVAEERDASGEVRGYFVTVWEQASSSSWLVHLDKNGAPLATGDKFSGSDLQFSGAAVDAAGRPLVISGDGVRRLSATGVGDRSFGVDGVVRWEGTRVSELLPMSDGTTLVGLTRLATEAEVARIDAAGKPIPAFTTTARLLLGKDTRVHGATASGGLLRSVLRGSAYELARVRPDGVLDPPLAVPGEWPHVGIAGARATEKGVLVATSQEVLLPAPDGKAAPTRVVDWTVRLLAE